MSPTDYEYYKRRGYFVYWEELKIYKKNDYNNIT